MGCPTTPLQYSLRNLEPQQKSEIQLLIRIIGNRNVKIVFRFLPVLPSLTFPVNQPWLALQDAQFKRNLGERWGVHTAGNRGTQSFQGPEGGPGHYTPSSDQQMVFTLGLGRDPTIDCLRRPAANFSMIIISSAPQNKESGIQLLRPSSMQSLGTKWQWRLMKHV